jgi:hypothetical protein
VGLGGESNASSACISANPAVPYLPRFVLQAWQQRHDALLPLLLINPPAALLAGGAAVDPVAFPAPPTLVTSPHGAPDGSASLLHAALGMLPSQAPLSASLLLQAARADEQGRRLLLERAAAGSQLSGALRQYSAALACLLGGQLYAGTAQHAHWAAAFQAALALPPPQVGLRARQGLLQPC